MRIFLLGSTLLLASSVSLHADTLFNLSNATFSNGATATGTVRIDTVGGAFDSVDVTVANGGTDYVFSGTPTYQTTGDNGTQYFEESFDIAGNELVLDIPGASPVGYSGGALCSTASLCDGLSSGYAVPTSASTADAYTLASGSLVAATPEPSSLILLGTGLLGAVGVARRRFA